MRAMMVLALADVSFSFSMDKRVARGVEEPECSSGLDMLTSCGVLFGEQGGESAWYSSPYDMGLL